MSNERTPDVGNLQNQCLELRNRLSQVHGLVESIPFLEASEGQAMALLTEEKLAIARQSIEEILAPFRVIRQREQDRRDDDRRKQHLADLAVGGFR